MHAHMEMLTEVPYRPPAQVLYHFLTEFSDFDWERYCLSLQGPIPIANFYESKRECPGSLGPARSKGH